MKSLLTLWTSSPTERELWEILCLLLERMNLEAYRTDETARDGVEIILEPKSMGLVINPMK